MENGDAQLGPEMNAPLPAAASSALVERLAQTECPALTARRARRAELSGAAHDPIVWTAARGANVWDADGNRYVDLTAGFGAAAVGHTARPVVAAVQQQSERLMHALGDVHPSDVKITLLERLAAHAPWGDARVMLGLSGADAVAAALKSAALYTKRPGVLAFRGGYHGLEYGPLAACGYSDAFRTPFEQQLNPHVAFAPFPAAGVLLERALEDVAVLLRTRREIGAVLCEPVQGRGGVIVPPEGFIAGVAALCREYEVLLIADEVLTGLGRTGAMLRSVADGAEPDLICLGKALGGGLPISACIGRGDVMAAWGQPSQEAIHTGTFFGNPLACAAALAALDMTEALQLTTRARHVGEEFAAELRARLAGRVVDVRGAGMLIGVELASGAAALGAVRALLERGYLTLPAASDARVISLTPPLTIEETLLSGFVETLSEVLA